MKMKTFLKNGVRQGEELQFHVNGNIYYQGSYKDGVKIGDWNYYTEEGVLDTVIYYYE